MSAVFVVAFAEHCTGYKWSVDFERNTNDFLKTHVCERREMKASEERRSGTTERPTPTDSPLADRAKLAALAHHLQGCFTFYSLKVK